MVTQQRVDGASYHVTERAAWSPAQFVAVAAGLVLTVIGGVALARSGVHLSSSVIPLTRSSVAGLEFTSMSALIQLIVGIVLLIGGAYPYSAKATMGVFGVVLVAFGLIVAIDPTAFDTMWGFSTANGVFYAVVGAVLLIGGVASPVFFSKRRTVAQQSGVSTSEPIAIQPPVVVAGPVPAGDQTTVQSGTVGAQPVQHV